MYCFNCGAKVNEEDCFCEHCGAHLRETSVSTDDAPAEINAQIEEPEIVETAASKRNREEIPDPNGKFGLLLTNTDLLANAVKREFTNSRGNYDAKTAKQYVTDILLDYIARLKKNLIYYTLVDAADYQFRAGGKKKGKRIHLDTMEPWWNYQELLYDQHQYEVEKCLPVSTYLFIVGGNDVVPMPVIKSHLSSEDNQQDVETDLLYAYPYGKESKTWLETAQIFKYEMLFLTARLPLGADFDCNGSSANLLTLKNYLIRASKAIAKGGVELHRAYAQCDPHWQLVTKKVLYDVITHDMLPHFPEQMDAYCNESVVLSPPVTMEQDVVDAFFAPDGKSDANLIYFNMHGSGAPQNPQYFGEDMEGNFYKGFAPKQMSYVEQNNVVVTEACYGGKFIRYDCRSSMLLSAMLHKSVLFVGSSRPAYGCVDNPQATSWDDIGVGNADVLCGRFVDYFLMGQFTAGEAMFLARKELCLSQEMNPCTALTLSEFNLYGDPMISVAASPLMNQKSVSAPKTVAKGGFGSKSLETFVDKDAPVGWTLKSVDENQSILAKVRSAVNENIKSIRESVNHHLYEAYHIDVREPEGIFECEYASGKKEIMMVYKPSKDPLASEVLVTTAMDGKVKSVLTTK